MPSRPRTTQTVRTAEAADAVAMDGNLPHWAYAHCSAYTVLAGKGKNGDELNACVSGGDVDVTTLPPSLKEYFARDVETYDHEILFTTTGRQQNDVRDEIRFLATGTPAQRKAAARRLAVRLAERTDTRSNDGLLVIVVGTRRNATRVALWKLPKGEAFQAKRVGGIYRLLQLNAFASKDSKVFKGAAFDGTLAATAFWEGRAQDNQVKTDAVAQYWIHEFLACQHKLTDGRFNTDIARGIQAAIHAAPTPADRAAVLAVPQVLRNRAGQALSLDEVQQMLPEAVRQEFVAKVGIPANLTQEAHRIEADVYEHKFRTRIIEINDAFTIHGPDDTFDEVVQQETLQNGQTRLTMVGRVTRTDLKAR